MERDFLFISEKINIKKLNIDVNEKGNYKFFRNIIKFEIINFSDFSFIKDPKIAQIDFEKIKFPLTIRKWKNGDSFRPYGLNGTKKVSDFLIDNKVPSYIKIFQGVVLFKNKIVWLIGHQIDDKFKVKDKTRKVLRISIN